MGFKKLLFTLIAFSFGALLKAQTVPAIYLHTDRAAYFPGDTIWFKGYIVQKGGLDSTVNNLYIDWGNAEGSVLDHNVYIVIRGMAPSQFVIPPDYTEKQLNLNAYTTNLAGHKELGYFKTIAILQKTTKNTQGQPNDYFLSVFPKDGFFLKGAMNKILLKSYDRQGNAINIKGKISADGNPSIAFETDSNGLAEINLMGSDEEQNIIWSAPDGSVHNDKMPVSLAEGIKLDVDETADSVIVQFASTYKSKPKGKIESWLNYGLLFSKEIDLGKGNSGFKFPKQGLGAGLLQVLIFDEAGKRVTKQSLMIGVANLVIAPKVDFSINSKKPKSKNVLAISLPDREVAELSVSITDAEVPVDSTHTLVDGVLFGSMSNTRTAKPFIYFRNSDLLNHFVQTNDWSDNFAVLKQIPFTPDSVIYLKGRIVMKDSQRATLNKQLDRINQKRIKKKEPIRGVSFGYQGIKDKVMLYKEIFPDREGYFSLKDFSFADSMKIKLVQVESVPETFAKFGARYNFSPVAKPDRLYLPDWYKAERANDPYAGKKWTSTDQYYVNEEGLIMLKAVNILKKRNFRLERMDKALTIGDFSKPSLLAIDVQNDSISPYIYTTAEYLQDLIIRRYPHIFRQLDRPYAYAVNNSFIIQEIPQDLGQITYIKVFKSIRGSSVIAIYTTGSDGRNLDYGKAFNMQTIMGYADIKQFYSPLYPT